MIQTLARNVPNTVLKLFKYGFMYGYLQTLLFVDLNLTSGPSSSGRMSSTMSDVSY